MGLKGNHPKYAVTEAQRARAGPRATGLMYDDIGEVLCM